MRVLLSNLGCKLNQAELDHLGRDLLRAGHDLVQSVSEAQVHVLNTCNVTHIAARDSRKLARRGKRLNPMLKTVLTGCYVTGQPEDAARLAGVDLVVANGEKDRLLERLEEAFPEFSTQEDGVVTVPVPYVPMTFGHSRALVKIEDGCNMRCSFCVIPFMRGPQTSRPLGEVLTEVRGLAAAGYQEVVVTGVQISAYSWRNQGLFELTQALLDETTIPRLRLTSIAPWQFDRRLFRLFSSGRLCRHVHLSLQSGCAETLRRMRRPYTSEEFAHLVTEIRQRVPGIAITTDVIVGFPGETDSEFVESLDFCRRIAFSRLHAFPFSSRPGTEAADMSPQVPHAVKRQRMDRMLAESRRTRVRFEQEHAGTSAEVLWEFRRRGTWHGMTDNYLRVVTECDDELANRITPVHLSSRGALGLHCSLRSAPSD